jgi:hypothetical protein
VDSFVEGNTGSGIYLMTAGHGDPPLTLNGSEISRNTGSGIIAYYSTLDIDGSLIAGNGHSGIRVTDSLMNLSTSTISGNTTIGDGGGLALYDVTDNEVVATTIADNSAGGFGGGIYLDVAGTFEQGLEMTNSTISGNRADRYGGGMYYAWGEASQVYLEGVTIAYNIADDDDTNDGDGGGISTSLMAEGLKLKYSVLAHNLDATTGAGPQLSQNCQGYFISEGYNLVERNDASACGIIGGVGDLLGTFASPIDPLLGPLQLNGGSTETHALLAGSPAINAGEAGACTDIDGDPFIMDQRGVSRPKGLACDMGAYENEYPYWLYLPLVVR